MASEGAVGSWGCIGEAVDYADSDEDSVDSELDQSHDHGESLIAPKTIAYLREKFGGGDRAEPFKASQRSFPIHLAGGAEPRLVQIAQDYLLVDETGGAVYDAALILVDFLLHGDRLCELGGGGGDERPQKTAALAIELGTGPGFVSVALGLAGARVICTDGDPQVLDLARRNAERNGVPTLLDGPSPPPTLEGPGWLRPLLLRWADPSDIAKVVDATREALQPLDAAGAATPLVLLSDLIYPGSDLQALEATVRGLATELDPVFCMSHAKRTRAKEVQFLRRLAASGFELHRELRWAPRAATTMGSMYIHCFRLRPKLAGGGPTATEAAKEE